MPRAGSRLLKLRPLPWMAAAVVLLSTGCSGVYFNTTFNAEKAYEQALDMRAKRLQQNPDDSVAVTAEERTKLMRAISKSSKVLELWPEDPEYAPRAVFRIAESQFLMEDYDAAAIKYDEYLRAFPEGERVELARVRRAQSLYRDGQDLAARDALAEVFAANPTGDARREALLLQARMSIDEASGLEGLALYEQLLTDGSINSPEARLELHWRTAQLAADLGEWERARYHALQADAPTVSVRARYRQKRLAVVALYELGRHAEGLAEVRTMWGLREYRVYRADLKLLEGIGTQEQGGGGGEGEAADADAWVEALGYYREAIRLESRSPAAAEAWYRIGRRVLDVDDRADSARAFFDSAAAAARSSEWGERGAEAAAALKRVSELVERDTVWTPRRFLGLDTLEAARVRDSLAAIAALAAPADTVAADSGAAVADAEIRDDGDDAEETEEAEEKDGRAEAGSGDAKPKPDKPSVRRPDFVHEAPFLIAELYHFRLPKPDSARKYLRRIVESPYEDSMYTRRALYALAWLEQQHFADEGGTARADSLYRALLARYPETEWAKAAESNLGLPATVQTPDDRAGELFRTAERRMVAGENVQTRVIPAYRAVAEQYPASTLAPRALYAIAVLTEQEALKGPPGQAAVDRVVAAYQVLRERYSGTPFSDMATTRINLLQSGASPEEPEDTRGGRVSGDPEEEEVEEPTGPRRETLDPAGEEDLY